MLLNRPVTSGPLHLSSESANENDSSSKLIPEFVAQLQRSHSIVSPTFHLACAKSNLLSCSWFWGLVVVLVGLGCFLCVCLFVSLFLHQEIHSNVVKDDLCTMHTWRLHPCKKKSGLTSLTLPSADNFLGSSACENCRHLSQVDLSATVIKVINEHTFSQCKELTHIRFPSTLREIHTEAFAYCETLQEVELPPPVYRP